MGMVTTGCFFICVFAVLINKVFLQVTVEAIIGGSVVLPCSSAEHELKRNDTCVHWRDINGKIVFDIIKGDETLEKQDHRYKNRTESFPSEYPRNNFSIKLTNLTHADGLMFVCSITPSNEVKTVLLLIKESAAETGNKKTGSRKPRRKYSSRQCGEISLHCSICISSTGSSSSSRASSSQISLGKNNKSTCLNLFFFNRRPNNNDINDN